MTNIPKITIFAADSNGGYPIPAVNGGAVSCLIEEFAWCNQQDYQSDLTIVSFYNKKAKDVAQKYSNTEFVWIKPNLICKILDKTLYFFVKTFFKKRKTISYKTCFSLLYYINKSSKLIKKLKSDYVILENNIPLAKIIKKSKYNGKFFYHFHNIPRIAFGCLDVFKKCTGFITVSDFISKSIQKESSAIGKIPSEKCHCLYNTIDTDLFHKISNENELFKLREKYNLTIRDKIILFAGRLSEEKGLKELIEAFIDINNDEYKLLIVGSLLHGENRRNKYIVEIQNIAKKSENIIFTGYIPNDQLPSYYSLANIVVLPSIWEEPAGLTMIEAMACECTVLTTASGGIPEYVGSDAILVDKDEATIPENLKKFILSYFDNVQSFRQYSANSRNRIVENFDRKNYLKKLVNILINESIN